MIVVRTLLRLSFVGGGSDLPAYYRNSPGRVISSAIDKYVYVIVKERFDDMIYVNYSIKECVDRVDQIRHELVREALRITGIDRGVEITTLADIPSKGSGLGSSSAVTVGLLHALYTYRNQLVTAEQLAHEACRIEIDRVGKPIGRQDQYACAFGGLNRFVFHSDHSVDRRPLTMQNGNHRRFSSSLLLYYTGITRSADTILSQQGDNFRQTRPAEIMGRMVSLVNPFSEAMQRGDLETCGQLMHQNWVLKRQMAEGITNPKIEDMYDRARRAGALGGKIAGAGGGGFLLLLVPRNRQSKVFEAMTDYREMPFMLERGGSAVIFCERRYSSR